MHVAHNPRTHDIVCTTSVHTTLRHPAHRRLCTAAQPHGTQQSLQEHSSTDASCISAAVFPKTVGMLPTIFRNTYADSIAPGNETNIHVACRAILVPHHQTVRLLGVRESVLTVSVGLVLLRYACYVDLLLC